MAPARPGKASRFLHRGRAAGLSDTNAAAEALLRDAAVVIRSFDRFDACRQCDRARLDRAFAAARHAGLGRTDLGDEMLEVEILRMTGSAPALRFLVLAREAAEAHCKVAQAARDYCLTRAEERLLGILFDGRTLAEAAANLGVVRTTARTHLQRLFDKTGTRRQADLLRTVALSGDRLRAA